MKFLLWEIYYVGPNKVALTRFNRKLIKSAKDAGKRNRYPGGKFNKIFAIKEVRGSTNVSLKEAYDFCKKYVFE